MKEVAQLVGGALRAIVFLCAAPAGAAATIAELPPTGPQPTVLSPQGVLHRLYSESNALLISAGSYSGGWRALPSTHQELDQLADLLRLHGFKVVRMKDPTGDELFRTLRDFAAMHGRSADSRFLVMYSGHGFTNKVNQMGYLVPIDATDPRTSPQAFLRTAMPIRQLELLATEIESRHALFLFDSCFSGAIFARRSELSRPDSRGNSPSDRWRFMTGKAREPVRQFIAAGGADEELPGKSVFLPLLMRVLDGTANISSDGYVSGKEVGLWLEQNLPAINPTQNPRSDLIRDPAYLFGDMIFQLPDKNRLTAARPSIATETQGQADFSVDRGVQKPRQAAPSASDAKDTQVAAVQPKRPNESDEVSWAWPAVGRTIATFDERNNKGVDIAGTRDQPVLAAANGKVVYSGDGLRGYGRLIILKHNNTYLSAYAHNSVLLVKEDDEVRQGQPIARMGSTDTNSVRLHFEIRKQGKPVDPLLFLPQR